MARGFESKAVESQQEEAARRRGRKAEPAPAAADRALAERRRSLELARARVEADLRSATRPAHLEMLRRALASLGEQIDALPKEESP